MMMVMMGEKVIIVMLIMVKKVMVIMVKLVMVMMMRVNRVMVTGVVMKHGIGERGPQMGVSTCVS